VPENLVAGTEGLTVIVDFAGTAAVALTGAVALSRATALTGDVDLTGEADFAGLEDLTEDVVVEATTVGTPLTGLPPPFEGDDAIIVTVPRLCLQI